MNKFVRQALLDLRPIRGDFGNSGVTWLDGACVFSENCFLSSDLRKLNDDLDVIGTSLQCFFEVFRLFATGDEPI